MDRLIGIFRNVHTLTARLVRQNVLIDFTDSAAVEQAVLDKTCDWYELVDCPLPLLTPGLTSQARLLEAWDALSDCRSPDENAVRLVLSETVLGQPPRSIPPPLVAETQVSSIKPTAAHPRAYAGTKYKPPKPKAIPARDWRPFLSDARSVAEAPLPEAFRISLYPLVRHQSETEIAETLALYWAMSLDSSPERLAAVAYLFCLQSNQNTRDWCRLITGQLPEHWTMLVHLLIASGADTADCLQLPPSFSEILAEVLDGKDAYYRAYWVLVGVAEQIDPKYQIDPAYLLAGYRLADTYDQTYRCHTVRRSGYFPMAAVLAWGKHCRDSDDFYNRMLLYLWEECGLRPGLGECLEQTDWTQLTPEAACRCLRLFAFSWNNSSDLPEAEAEAKWVSVHPMVGAMLSLLQSVPPEYQHKCAWHLIEYLWQWDTPKELQANLPSALALTQRLCRPPFAVKSDPTEVTTDFLAHLSLTLREQFLHAPDTSFRRLEQACRRENDTWLIGRGTYALTRHQAEFTVSCFETEPVRLFKAAKILGTLPKPMRDAVVRAFTSDIGETMRGGLERLEQATLAALAQGFSADVPDQIDKHALQMTHLIKDNQRALRKFLAAHWKGRTDYREMHPLTQQWLAAHPQLALETWQDGIVSHAEIETLGAVTLAVEQDPLEALKLGTYVGSCLGLGGSFAHSAAAVVLDLNKQVIYARDRRRTVVGRQLVAISEANQLVCYEVYPLSAQKELGCVFAEFDRRFASALGLPIYNQDKTEEYEIAHILSHAWWDDSVWDLALCLDTRKNVL